jgi:hypothetical protein
MDLRFLILILISLFLFHNWYPGAEHCIAFSRHSLIILVSDTELRMAPITTSPWAMGLEWRAFSAHKAVGWHESSQLLGKGSMYCNLVTSWWTSGYEAE